jgi:hypothetical protein
VSSLSAPGRIPVVRNAVIDDARKSMLPKRKLRWALGILLLLKSDLRGIEVHQALSDL